MAALLIALAVHSQDFNRPLLTSHDEVDGPFGGQSKVEDLRLFKDGRAVYIVNATFFGDAAKTQRLTYKFNVGPDEMRHLEKLLDSAEIRALPSEIESRTRPIDFFWQKSLEIDRTGTSQKTHIRNFYPFLNEHEPAYPQALIELECTLLDIESAATKRPKDENDWCRSVLGVGAAPTFATEDTTSQQVQPVCREDQAKYRVAAGKGWGPVQIGVDLKTVDAALGKGLAGSKYSDDYFREYPPNGIEVSFDSKGNTVHAIYFYNGQWDSVNVGAFCGQTDRGINWRSTAEDVKRVYGRPESDFSDTDSGGTWERLVFEGIDFRFENGKMVRIGIPGQ